jgi:hypothetical protein
MFIITTFLFIEICETNNSIKNRFILSPKQKPITRNGKLITYLTFVQMHGINQ